MTEIFDYEGFMHRFAKASFYVVCGARNRRSNRIGEKQRDMKLGKPYKYYELLDLNIEISLLAKLIAVKRLEDEFHCPNCRCLFERWEWRCKQWGEKTAD